MDLITFQNKQPVASVAFSVDGTRIVSGSNDYTVKIWNATPVDNTQTEGAKPEVGGKRKTRRRKRHTNKHKVMKKRTKRSYQKKIKLYKNFYLLCNNK